jgi:ATP-dependent DNA helicase RecG
LDILNNDIKYLKGVGPKKSLLLKKMNLQTIEDLIYYIPKSFEDRTKLNKLIEAIQGEKQVFKVTVTEKPVVISTRKGLHILKVTVEDDSGTASLVWFNQDYIKQKIKLGQDD